MNSVEHVLYEELTHLLDRLATSVPQGLAEAAAANHSLRRRLDEADAQPRGHRCWKTTAGGVARWRTSRTSGRWRRGVDQRPKRRASSPRPSRPESPGSVGAMPLPLSDVALPR